VKKLKQVIIFQFPKPIGEWHPTGYPSSFMKNSLIDKPESQFSANKIKKTKLEIQSNKLEQSKGSFVKQKVLKGSAE
jgi:hypothetical protein